MFKGIIKGGLEIAAYNACIKVAEVSCTMAGRTKDEIKSANYCSKFATSVAANSISPLTVFSMGKYFYNNTELVCRDNGRITGNGEPSPAEEPVTSEIPDPSTKVIATGVVSGAVYQAIAKDALVKVAKNFVAALAADPVFRGAAVFVGLFRPKDLQTQSSPPTS